MVSAQEDAALVIWADADRTPILRDVAAQFEEEQGLAIEVVEVPFDEMRDQFTTAAPQGEGPDIITGAHDWVGELAVSGLLSPIEITDDKRDQFLQPALDAFSADGTLYGVPYALENIAFFRNTDLVPEAPATWDEVRQVSEELVASGEARYGYVIQENDPYHFFPLQTAFGGYIFGYDEGAFDTSDIGIDAEGSIAALEWLQSYVEAGLMPSGLEYNTMHELFEAGDAAMMITGPWALERINESGVPYAISPIPGTEGVTQGSPFVGVQGFMVSAFSENATLANLFLTDYVATEAVMGQIFEAGSRPSAFLPVRETTDSETLEAFGMAGMTGVPQPAIPQMSAVFTIWGNAIEQVVQGRADAETAFNDAADLIAEAVGANAE